MSPVAFKATGGDQTGNEEPERAQPDPEAKRILRELFTYAAINALAVIVFIFLYINTFRLSEALIHTLSTSLMPALIVLFLFAQWKFFGVVMEMEKRKQKVTTVNRRMMTIAFAVPTSLFSLGMLYIYFIEVLRVLD